MIRGCGSKVNFVSLFFFHFLSKLILWFVLLDDLVNWVLLCFILFTLFCYF